MFNENISELCSLFSDISLNPDDIRDGRLVSDRSPFFYINVPSNVNNYGQPSLVKSPCQSNNGIVWHNWSSWKVMLLSSCSVIV